MHSLHPFGHLTTLDLTDNFRGWYNSWNFHLIGHATGTRHLCRSDYRWFMFLAILILLSNWLWWLATNGGYNDFFKDYFIIIFGWKIAYVIIFWVILEKVRLKFLVIFKLNKAHKLCLMAFTLYTKIFHIIALAQRRNRLFFVSSQWFQLITIIKIYFDFIFCT